MATTPTALDAYTRLMVPAFKDLDLIPIETFFQQLFAVPNGKTVIEFDASVVDIDIQRGTKNLAAYIPRGTSAVNTGSTKEEALLEKYSTISRLYPLIEEETPINSGMIMRRMAGEPVNSPFSQRMKQTALAMEAHKHHMNRIISKQELSAAEALRTGLQTVDGGEQINFYRNSTHNINASTAWGTAATASPVLDFTTAGNLIHRDGHRQPTDVVLGATAWTEFLATTEILALADLRRINHFISDMNNPAPAGYESWTAGGALFQGQIKAGNWNLNLWTYPAVYGSSNTPFLPLTEAIMIAKGARYDRYFGPQDRLNYDDSFLRKAFGIGDLKAMPQNVLASGIFSSDMFHVDAYGGANGKNFTVRTQSAPIYAPIEADTIVKLLT